MEYKDLQDGMKVWIRDDLKVGELYGNDVFVEGMKHLTGLQQVTRIGNMIIQIDGWHFTSEMIDWEKTKKLNKKSELIYDGTILIGQINGKEIKVTRSDKDKEDLEKAVMMALLKSLGVTYVDVKDLKNKVKKVWRPQEDEKYYFVTSHGTVDYTYNYDTQVDKELFDFGNCFKTEEEAEKKVVEVRRVLKNKED